MGSTACRLTLLVGKRQVMGMMVKTALVCGLALIAACQSLGPRPEMMTSDGEIKATKAVDKILVEPTLGTGSGDAENDVNKTIPAGAYERYGDNIVQVSALDGALKTLGFHKDLVAVLPINWQVAFYHWVKELKGGKPAKNDFVVAVPSFGKKAAKSDRDLKRLAAAIRKRQKALEPLQKVMAANQAEPVDEAQMKAKKDLTPVENLNRHLLTRLQVTYVLASYLDGSAESFAKNEPITMHVALINADTGKIRFYARSSGKKSDLPTNFEGLLGMMSHNLFEDIKDVDHIDL